ELHQRHIAQRPGELNHAGSLRPHARAKMSPLPPTIVGLSTPREHGPSGLIPVVTWISHGPGSAGQACLGYRPAMSLRTSAHEPFQKPGRSEVTWIGRPAGESNESTIGT